MKSWRQWGIVERLAGQLRQRGAYFSAQAMDLLFPPQCVHCEAELPPEHGPMLLCKHCCLALGPESWSGCRRCGSLEAAEFALAPADCCACRRAALRFDGVIPLGAYDGVLRDAVLKTKRLLHENVAIALGHLLAHRRKGELADFRPDLIVPIPMHWRRRFMRGTNGPEVLARCLGKRLGVAVAARLLVRTRNTRPQMELTPVERIHNVRGAFRLRRGGRGRLRDSRILLVDDILTSGATCSEAADVLKQSGVAAVAAAVIARAQAGTLKYK